MTIQEDRPSDESTVDTRRDLRDAARALAERLGDCRIDLIPRPNETDS